MTTPTSGVEVDEGYVGPASLVTSDDREIAVRVHLSGRFEPVAGTYQWTGRVDPDPGVTALVEDGEREVVLRTYQHQASALLGEANPWGGFRITGRGRPPFPVPEAEIHTVR